MKLSQLNAQFKNVLLSEMLLNDFNISNCNYLLDNKIEQYICDNYQSKFEEFKVNLNKEELTMINVEFVSIK